MKNLLIVLTLMLGISSSSYGEELTVKAVTSFQTPVCMEEDGLEGLPCEFFAAYEELNEENSWHLEIMEGLGELLPIRALVLCERKTGMDRDSIKVEKVSDTKFGERVYPGINYGLSSEWKVMASAQFKCVL